MPDVTGARRGKLEDAGLDIVACGSMEEESDERVACIDQQSIRQAVLTIGRSAPCDAVFLACTNLRGLPVIQDMESELGIPVLTSNQVLLWHMMSLAGVSTAHLPFGALMRCPDLASDRTIVAPQRRQRTSSRLFRSLSISSPICASVMMKGGASKTWSPRCPSMVPLIG